MTRPSRLPLALALVLGLSGCASRTPPPPPADGMITVLANVSYRQRVALPPTAVVRVQLQDVGRADAPARILDEATLTTQGAQAPFALRLRAPVETTAPPARVVLRARIEVDGQLRFTNTSTILVPIPPPAQPIEVMVEPVPEHRPR